MTISLLDNQLSGHVKKLKDSASDKARLDILYQVYFQGRRDEERRIMNALKYFPQFIQIFGDEWKWDDESIKKFKS